MHPPIVYTHPYSTSTLLQVLRPLLPNGLPLYRRLQSERKSEHAHVLATFAPGTSLSTETDGREENGVQNSHHSIEELEGAQRRENGVEEMETPRCFAAAYVDRSARPGTEMYVFVSGEADGRCGCAEQLGVQATGDIRGVVSDPEHDTYRDEGYATATQNGHTNGFDSTTHQPPCAAALLALLAHISTLPFPAHTPAQLTDIHRAATLLSTPSPFNINPLKSHYPPHTTFLTDINTPAYLKLGAASALPVSILHAAGLLKQAPTRTLAHSVYVFRVPDGLPTGRELGDGLRWGVPRERDLDLVRVRTPIPRTHAALRGMSGVAVFPAHHPTATTEEDVSPVAWAFVGYDGGLCSLHVEPEYRGRGIAKTLAARLFAEYAQEDGWALAFVGVGNRESEAVCGGIGGEVRSWCWWVRVDLKAVRRLEGGEQ